LARWVGCDESKRAVAEEIGKTAAMDALRFTNSLRVVSEESRVRRTAAEAAAMTAISNRDVIEAVRFCRKGVR
jgi:hypothetical protein